MVLPAKTDPRLPTPIDGPELDLRAMVFHVRPHEEQIVRRALRRFGGPRRRRGASLAAAMRALAKKVD